MWPYPAARCLLWHALLSLCAAAVLHNSPTHCPHGTWRAGQRGRQREVGPAQDSPRAPGPIASAWTSNQDSASLPKPRYGDLLPAHLRPPRGLGDVLDDVSGAVAGKLSSPVPAALIGPDDPDVSIAAGIRGLMGGA